jgi:hypothetical protein
LTFIRTDRAPRGPSTPAEDDREAEQAVLAFLLEEHPAQLTIPEVSLALNAAPASFPAFDAIERAIRELDGAGLLHCHHGFATPTRAALYFAHIWGV